MRKIEKADAGVCITQQCFTAVPAEGCRTVFVCFFFFPPGEEFTCFAVLCPGDASWQA